MPIALLLRSTLILPLLLCFFSEINAQNDLPNILLIITDDLGVDYTNGYHEGPLMPNTPTLDSLMATGITFENVFATPRCSPSRAAIMSGKYGVNNGVPGVPGHLDTSNISIFKALENQTGGQYADAAIGKWHLSSPADPQHPIDHGADHYMGVLGAMVDDYYAWNKTEDGQTTVESGYVTSTLTDAAINWINAQNQPWFLWLAHVAPHTPFHVPPSHLFTISNTNNNNRRYVAMIESVDHELNRLLNSIPDDVRENTIIIYVGDNGSPGAHLQDYPMGHGKGTLYQGGVRVPLIISGAGVSRQGERESALVHIADIYATLLELAGAELPGGIYNSLSFDHLLKNEPGVTRDHNYSEIKNNSENGFTIRGPQYKLIESITDGTQEFYDLLNDSLETNNLLDDMLTDEQINIKNDLEAEAEQIRTAWSCRDYIQNGDEEGIDCGGTFCSPCITASKEVFEKNGINIYPNPSVGLLNITSEKYFIQEIKIFNTIGELLFLKKNINRRHEKVEINDFSPQVLFVEVKFKTGSELKRVIKF